MEGTGQQAHPLHPFAQQGTLLDNSAGSAGDAAETGSHEKRCFGKGAVAGFYELRHDAELVHGLFTAMVENGRREKEGRIT